MKDIINKVRLDPPKVRIGKNGITEGIIREVQNVLSKDKAVKIKCLKVIPTDVAKNIGENLAKLTDSEVVDLRGKTIILAIK
ncbi:YhbY family RNA-binding protein [Candidatus Heimdallarchaeota archaeon]|nr:MAG: YhbY family RNA-binding protein [Candidatus Heimdallarchaeota archaeon]